MLKDLVKEVRREGTGELFYSLQTTMFTFCGTFFFFAAFLVLTHDSFGFSLFSFLVHCSCPTLDWDL